MSEVRCEYCYRTIKLLVDGRLAQHNNQGRYCPGSLYYPRRRS